MQTFTLPPPPPGHQHLAKLSPGVPDKHPAGWDVVRALWELGGSSVRSVATSGWGLTQIRAEVLGPECKDWEGEGAPREKKAAASTFNHRIQE